MYRYATNTNITLKPISAPKKPYDIPSCSCVTLSEQSNTVYVYFESAEVLANLKTSAWQRSTSVDMMKMRYHMPVAVDICLFLSL